MPITRTRATSLLNKSEMDLYDDSRANPLRRLDAAALSSRIDRARKARDRARDLVQRHKLASRRRTGSKRGPTDTDNQRSREKAELLADILKRFEAQLKLARKSEAAADKAARASQKSSTAKSKKAAAKQPAARRESTKRGAAKKAAGTRAKKSTAKKSVAKKSAAKKSTAKKSTAKKTTAKKSTAKKSTAKKSTVSAKKRSGRKAASGKASTGGADSHGATAGGAASKGARKQAARTQPARSKASAAKSTGKSTGGGKRAGASGARRRRAITPEQALENTRALLEAKQEQARRPKSWQAVGGDAVDAPVSGFQSESAARRAEELHAGETRLPAIQGSIGTRDRINQGKRDRRGGSGG